MNRFEWWSDREQRWYVLAGICYLVFTVVVPVVVVWCAYAFSEGPWSR